MESQDNEKEYERSVWEIYRKEWETASPEKKVGLNKRMRRWQELMKNGWTAQQAYVQVMGEGTDTPQKLISDDDEDPREERIAQTYSMKALRWIAVVPAGIAAAVLITFPIHWFLILWVNIGDAPFFGLISAETIEHIERLIIAFTTPFFIIHIGALIAPTYHKETGVALAVFSALILGGLYVFAFTGGPYLRNWNSIYFGATPVLNLAGIATALYLIRRRYQ